MTTAPANGTATVNTTTGAVTYTPKANFNGADSLGYRVCDTAGLCASATLSVTVTAVNDAPVAVDDTATTAEDTAVTVNVAGNDTDADGDLNPGSVTVTVVPAHGAVSVNATSGAVTYTPAANSNGTDSFTYRICDTDGTCASAVARLTVTAVDDTPAAVNDSASTKTATAVAVDVTANDSDVDGNLSPATVTVTTAPANGSTSVNTTTGAVTYTPKATFLSGTDTFTYRVCDTTGLCATATVIVTVRLVNTAPVGRDDTATTTEDNGVTVAVLDNDTDAENNIRPASVTVTTAPASGTTTVNTTTGAISYTPTADFNGSDSLVYRVCDSAGACSTATVRFTVTAVDDAPIARDDTASTAEDTPVTVTVAANDTDVDGNLLATSVTVVTSPGHGTAGVDSGTGVLTYTPELNYSGPDTVVYRICDSSGVCGAATVHFTVSAVADPPDAGDDAATTDEETAVAVDVAGNDTDPDGDLEPGTVTVIVAPSNGPAAVNPTDGAVTYTPRANFNGTDSLTYRICDVTGACDTAVVSVIVRPVVDSPVANADSATTDEDTRSPST